MRRHPPRLLQLSEEEKTALEQLVRSGRVQQRIARRARVLLAMSRPQTVVQELAAQVAMSGHGIWYLCRRYEGHGLDALWDAPRSGRPRQISPLGAGANRTVGLL